MYMRINRKSHHPNTVKGVQQLPCILKFEPEDIPTLPQVRIKHKDKLERIRFRS